MELFFKDQISKIAWRRVAIIAFVWTVFSMQGRNFKTPSYSVGFGIGHGITAYALLVCTGALTTKKSTSERIEG